MSNKSEQKILKAAGATPHKNSGRGMKKGDGSNAYFVIDVKEAGKSFTLNQSVWNKICTDAYKVDPYKHPQLLVVLGGSTRLAVIEADVLQHIIEDMESLAIECNHLSNRVKQYEEDEWLRNH